MHGIFALPFDEIARVVQRSETAARQLASRARRRVRGATRVQETNLTSQRVVVDAFLSATLFWALHLGPEQAKALEGNADTD